jgi:hypothetical protein
MARTRGIVSGREDRRRPPRHSNEDRQSASSALRASPGADAPDSLPSDPARCTGGRRSCRSHGQQTKQNATGLTAPPSSNPQFLIPRPLTSSTSPRRPHRSTGYAGHRNTPLTIAGSDCAHQLGPSAFHPSLLSTTTAPRIPTPSPHRGRRCSAGAASKRANLDGRVQQRRFLQPRAGSIARSETRFLTSEGEY